MESELHTLIQGGPGWRTELQSLLVPRTTLAGPSIGELKNFFFFFFFCGFLRLLSLSTSGAGSIGQSRTKGGANIVVTLLRGSARASIRGKAVARIADHWRRVLKGARSAASVRAFATIGRRFLKGVNIRAKACYRSKF